MLSAALKAGLIAGAVYLMWDDFQDDCGYWLPAWGTLEGLARLFQPIDLGLISWRVHLNDGCGHLQRIVVSARLAFLQLYKCPRYEHKIDPICGVPYGFLSSQAVPGE